MESGLENLPPSGSKFWKYAEKIPSENKVVQDATNCSHSFRGRGNEVSCQSGCGWGFYLTAETELRDKHIYSLKTGKMII